MTRNGLLHLKRPKNGPVERENAPKIVVEWNELANFNNHHIIHSMRLYIQTLHAIFCWLHRQIWIGETQTYLQNNCLYIVCMAQHTYKCKHILRFCTALGTHLVSGKNWLFGGSINLHCEVQFASCLMLVR